MNKKNLAVVELGESVDAVMTTILLKAGHGTRLPAAPFKLTVSPRYEYSSPDNSEIWEVTAVAVDSITVDRAQYGTTAKSFAEGDIAVNAVYTQDFDAIGSEIALKADITYVDAIVNALDYSDVGADPAGSAMTAQSNAYTYTDAKSAQALADANSYTNTQVSDLESDVDVKLGTKVDKEAGKGLSTNDYTTPEKNKLSGIATGAEVNVQSDWNQSNTSADDYIKNKPSIPSIAGLATEAYVDQEVSDLSDEVDTKLAGKAIKKPSLVDYIRWNGGVTIAHRNAPLVYPEESLEGLQACYEDGVIIEVDVRALADGTLVCIHDTTVDRTMIDIPTGAVKSKTVAEWKNARIKPNTAISGIHGTPAFFEEVLDMYGGKVLIVPQLYDEAEDIQVAFIEAIKSRGLERDVIAQSFNYTVAQRFAAEGIETLVLNDSATLNPAEVKSMGINFIGGVWNNAAWTTERINDYKAAGLKTIGYTVTTKADSDAAFAKGWEAIFSDNPWDTVQSLNNRKAYHSSDAENAKAAVTAFNARASSGSQYAHVIDVDVNQSGDAFMNAVMVNIREHSLGGGYSRVLYGLYNDGSNVRIEKFYSSGDMVHTMASQSGLSRLILHSATGGPKESQLDLSSGAVFARLYFRESDNALGVYHNGFTKMRFMQDRTVLNGIGDIPVIIGNNTKTSNTRLILAPSLSTHSHINFVPGVDKTTGLVNGDMWYNGTDLKLRKGSVTEEIAFKSEGPIYGTGFPNGVVSAPVGTTYIDRNATNGAIEWKKATGTSNTGWQVSVGDTGWRILVSWDTAGVVTGTMPTNMSPKTGRAGDIRIRRRNAEVEFCVREATFAAGTVPIPNHAGFRSASPYYPMVPIVLVGVVPFGVGESFYFITTPAVTLPDSHSSSAIFMVTNDWPSTLPGTPA